MWVRIGAALAAALCIGLLVLVARASFAPDLLVVPVGGVTDGGPQDDLPAGAAIYGELVERTELQRWRGVSGPSPAQPAPEGTRLDPAAQAEGAVPDDAARVQNWLAARDRDWSLLQQPEFIRGEVNLPDARGEVLVQPQGRDWRRLHNDTLYHAGGWIIFGFGLVVALFLLLRGRIPLEIGFSGRPVLRFPPLERGNHWMTATSFIMLALTGLIILYGRDLIKPWLGAVLYRDLAAASLYLHVAFAIPFVIGILLMAAFWLRQNLPERTDLPWLAQFGGFLSNRPVKPPAHRFNAGQKLIFWGVVGGGLLLFASGLGLLYPFYWTDVIGMQWALGIHTGLALLMVALIIGHIYIGTVGMVGAFDAMWSGEVDRNWAEEHHRLWLAELEHRPPEEIERETARKHERRQHRRPAAAE